MAEFKRPLNRQFAEEVANELGIHWDENPSENPRRPDGPDSRPGERERKEGKTPPTPSTPKEPGRPSH